MDLRPSGTKCTRVFVFWSFIGKLDQSSVRFFTPTNFVRLILHVFLSMSPLNTGFKRITDEQGIITNFVPKDHVSLYFYHYKLINKPIQPNPFPF